MGLQLPSINLSFFKLFSPVLMDWAVGCIYIIFCFDSSPYTKLLQPKFSSDFVSAGKKLVNGLAGLVQNCFIYAHYKLVQN